MAAILRNILIHHCIIRISFAQNPYEIINFDKKINSFSSSCYLSISYFKNFHIPSNIRRPYQLTKYVPVEGSTKNSILTKENILLQPIDPIFRSLHAGPSCVIFVIIVKPELSQEYDTFAWFSLKNSPLKPNTLWNIKRRSRYFSYFNSGMIAFFGNISEINSRTRILTRSLLGQPIILFFQILFVKSIDSSYLIEPNFDVFCQNIKLAENIKLHRLLADCKKLVRPEHLRKGFDWKPQDFLNSISGMKFYSMQDSLNGVLNHMLNMETNTTDGLNPVVVEASLDMTSPRRLSFTRSDMTGMSFILVGNWSFSFVTCSSLTQSRVDYWGYVKPFSASVWYGLLLCTLLVTIFQILQNYSKYLSLSWHELAYAAINALLDIGFVIVQRSSSTFQIMFPNPASEKLLILWTLVTFVVVNIYMSIVTEDTTAPLVSNPPRMFDDLIEKGFRIYSSSISEDRYRFFMPQTLLKYRWGMSEFDAQITMRHNIWTDALSHEVRTAVIAVRSHRWCAARKTMIKLKDIPAVELHTTSAGNNIIKKLLRVYKDNHNLLTQAELEFSNTELGRIAEISDVRRSSLISEIVGKCDKTALVAPTVYVMSKSYVLKILGGTSSHLNRKPYVKSIGTAFSRSIYIRIVKWGAVSEALKEKIDKIVESGLYRFWEAFLIHVQTVGGIGRKGEESFSQQQLNSNILTVFFILSIAVSLCVVIFLVEVMPWWRMSILKVMRVAFDRYLALVKKYRRKGTRIVAIRVMCNQ
ncbi:hypothetical protein Fcan01_25077 [Folsomia candida]|uniref:Uncharacterized protein n=1 Tax=Folsomia candida TaxID=158441 RepID=A0A226D6N3_FOLCA|nr:hypothetical protein Fcan01_25077 [Folsomia candida]